MSKYFSKAEMACKCCGGLPEDGMSEVLLSKLDELRDLCNQPLSVSCMYRCPEHNAEVGGVPNSQHVFGEAADVIVPDDMTVDELADLAIRVGFDGIGRYYDSGFVHVDVRDGGRSPNYYTWTDQD